LHIFSLPLSLTHTLTQLICSIHYEKENNAESLALWGRLKYTMFLHGLQTRGRKKKSLGLELPKEWGKKPDKHTNQGNKKSLYTKNGTKFQVLIYISGYISKVTNYMYRGD
jgi:hypothetical protein